MHDLERPAQPDRPPRSLHAVRQARALPRRHAGAGCRAAARRLCRERVRRPGDLRALPDRGAGRQFRQAPDRLLQRPHIGPRAEGRALRPRARPAGAPAAVLLGQHPRRSRHRRAAGHGGQRAGGAQGCQRPGDRAQCRGSALLRRGRRTRHAQAAGRPRPAQSGAGARMGLEGRARRAPPHPAGAEDPTHEAAGPAGNGAGLLGRDRRHPPRHGNGPALHHRPVAGAEERGLRHRLRHRLDDDRHASGVAAVGTYRRLLRHVKPADPLRRGSDEPRLLRDDEPGRARGHDQGRARGGQRSDRQGLRGGQCRPPRHSGHGLRRQPDHAPPVPRHRPDRTRPGALRAGRVGRAAVLGT